MLEFIDILQISPSGHSHTSSFHVDAPERSGYLQALGNIPHACAIRPRTQADADKLRAWLDKHFPRVTP